MRLLLH